MFRFLTLFLQQMMKIERVVKYSNSKAIPLTKAQGSERCPSVFLCQRKTEVWFFFSSAYMCTCWVMFDSLWPCGQSSGSSVHWIFQARILEWVAISFSKGSSQPRDRTRVSCVGRWILYHCAILLLSDFTLWSMPWACASYITWCTIFHGFFTTWSCVSGR